MFSILLSYFLIISVVCMSVTLPRKYYNLPNEAYDGYIRADEIPPANNDPAVESVYSGYELDDNFNPDHSRKNTIVNNDVFDYMEETGDFRFLDHEVEKMLQENEKKYTEMLVRLAKYRKIELEDFEEAQRIEDEVNNSPDHILAQEKIAAGEEAIRTRDYENFLKAKAYEGFE